MLNRIDQFFGITKRGSSFTKELLGGLTTFLTMAYILFSNPALMSGFGAIQLDVASVFLATALAAGVATIAMGLFAKLPIALAPGMGLNAFFSFTIVLGMGYSWEQALAAVLVSGVLYLIISLIGLRSKVVSAIPVSLKYAIGAGIGFFIAYIGLVKSGIVVLGNPDVPTELGNLANPATLLAIFGLVLTVVLLALKVKAAVFFGLVGTALVGLIAGLFNISGMPVYEGIVGSVPSLTTFGAAFKEIGTILFTPAGWFVVFAFLFVDFFDTSGTLMAVTGQMKEITEEEIQKANVVDASATIVGAVLGTSTTTSYIESLSGIGVGARTGLASVVTGVLFLLSIFLSPLLSLITPSVTAASLIIVGTMMAGAIGKIDWEDWQVSIASFLTIITMILTYSISDGIGFGFIFYVIAMVFSGKGKKVSPLLYGVSGLFLIYLVLLHII